MKLRPLRDDETVCLWRRHIAFVLLAFFAPSLCWLLACLLLVVVVVAAGSHFVSSFSLFSLHLIEQYSIAYPEED